jgi:hypothetical protein
MRLSLLSLALLPLALLTLTLTACGADRPRADATVARATYDEAIIAALDGDAITWREKLVQLAAAHPDSPHGRAAVAQLGGSGALIGLSAMTSAFTAAIFDPPEPEVPIDPLVPEEPIDPNVPGESNVPEESL